MAWNTLKYKCDHTEEVQLYGKYTERDKVIAKAANKLCLDCYKKEQEEIYANKKNNLKINLPDLVGSEKQIKWAEKIRLDLIENVNYILDNKSIDLYSFSVNYKEIINKYDTFNKSLPLIEKKLRVFYKEETSAKWFIDNRYLVSKTELINVAEKIISDLTKEYIDKNAKEMEKV